MPTVTILTLRYSATIKLIYQKLRREILQELSYLRLVTDEFSFTENIELRCDDFIEHGIQV